jgi:hypothetical protein
MKKLSELSLGELKVGMRFLYRNTGEGVGYYSSARVSKIVEISPSREYINIEGYGWSPSDSTVIDVLEILDQSTK